MLLICAQCNDEEQLAQAESVHIHEHVRVAMLCSLRLCTQMDTPLDVLPSLHARP